jgi:hypothetical protein
MHYAEFPPQVVSTYGMLPILLMVGALDNQSRVMHKHAHKADVAGQCFWLSGRSSASDYRWLGVRESTADMPQASRVRGRWCALPCLQLHCCRLRHGGARKQDSHLQSFRNRGWQIAERWRASTLTEEEPEMKSTRTVGVGNGVWGVQLMHHGDLVHSGGQLQLWLKMLFSDYCVLGAHHQVIAPSR